MIPGSPEWARVVSASKVAAILGLSPWESPRTMWHKMRGEIPSDDGSNAEAKSRGHWLEPSILAWWRHRHQIDTWHEQVHCTIPELPWAAATPDLITTDDHGNLCVVDAKSAARADDWGTPGTDEAPAYYVAQAMWQLALVPDAQVAYIAVLFGSPRLDFAEYVIERDQPLIDSIVAQCRAFYDSLSADVPPPLSDHVAEYDAIRTAHPDIDRDADATIPDDIAHRYLLDLAHEQRAAASKARVLDAMGRARRAISESGLVVARRQPKGDAVTLVRVAALPELGA